MIYALLALRVPNLNKFRSTVSRFRVTGHFKTICNFHFPIGRNIKFQS